MATGLLAICSKLLLGQFNFITPTVRSARSLSTPAELRANHSASWSWAPYAPYLLVPPAIVLSFFVVVTRRRSRDVGTTQLFIGLTGALQLATFLYLQFIGSVQALEMHYFSSLLWSSVNVMLAMTVAEVTQVVSGPRRRGVLGSRPARASVRRARSVHADGSSSLCRRCLCWRSRWSTRAPLAWVWLCPRSPGLPGEPSLAAVVIAAAAIGRLTIASTKPAGDPRAATTVAARRLASATAVVVIVAGALVLTVAPREPHGPLANTVFDPATRIRQGARRKRHHLRGRIHGPLGAARIRRAPGISRRDPAHLGATGPVRCSPRSAGHLPQRVHLGIKVIPRAQPRPGYRRSRAGAPLRYYS